MIREPAVAGMFYPADPDELRVVVDGLLDRIPPTGEGDAAVAYVVPHAGYRFSGPTAAHVYARLRDRPAPARTVVIGPAHKVALQGAAVPVATNWRTPLGDVAIDVEAARSLVSQGLAVASDAPHAPEHSIEVQLPFLQRVQWRSVLPVCVGQSTVEHVVDLLESVTRLPDTVVLCSTDLSHYLSEEEARARDAQTAQAIADLAPERIGSGDACGRFALRGLLGWARAHHLAADILHLSTSADTGGGRDRVVGYPAAAFRPSAL